MKLILSLIYLTIVVSCGSHPIFAQDSATDTGKKAADKYFLKRKRRPSNQESSPPPLRKGPASSSKNFAGAPRYLALQLGLFTEEEAYKWGKSNKNDVSEYMIGITYRIGEWTNSMDLAIRADLVSFEVDDKSPTKLSLLPIVTFPDAKSGFPLYFGAGVGAGIFFKQAKEESHLSLDYQILAGARFFNLVSSMGLIFEAGLKNQLFLLSDGQHNGVYGSIGGVFTF